MVLFQGMWNSRLLAILVAMIQLDILKIRHTYKVKHNTMTSGISLEAVCWRQAEQVQENSTSITVAQFCQGTLSFFFFAVC